MSIRKEILHPDGVPEDDIYPKTSIDQVEGLEDTISELDGVDDRIIGRVTNLETRMTNEEAVGFQNSVAVQQLGDRVNALEQSSGGSFVKKIFTQKYGYMYVFDTFPTQKFVSIILGTYYHTTKFSSASLVPSFSEIVGEGASTSWILRDVNLPYYDGVKGEYGVIKDIIATLGYFQGEINDVYSRYPSISLDVNADVSITEQSDIFDYLYVGYVE